MMAPKTSKKSAPRPKRPAKAPSRKPAKRKKDGRGGARPGAGRPKGSTTRARRLEDYAELGGAPTDELEAIRWAFKANAIALRQVMQDKLVTDEKRRTEIRTISKVMNTLLPRARLRKAELTIRGELDRQAAPVDPKLEPAPAATRADREELEEIIGGENAVDDETPDEGEEGE